MAYTPAATRASEDAMALSVRSQLPANWELLDGPLAVTVWAYLPIPKGMPKRDWGIALPIRKPDIDNFCKSIDAFNGVIWTDDARIVDLNGRKRYAWTGSPRWEIEVSDAAI